MDCARLRLSIPLFRVSDDGSTHTFGISVVYGKLRWNVSHRFSEYISLYDQLLVFDLAGVPTPPPKSLGRLSTSAALEARRLMLEVWLKLLCKRPDIRTCPPFVDFIEFELHTSASVTPLTPHLLTICKEPKLLLSDFQWIASSRIIIASYEEAASMARLGKVWNLVENDELGGLSVWSASSALHHSTDQAATEPYFDKILHTSGHHRNRSLYYHSASGRIFVGLETGAIEIYRYPPKSLSNTIRQYGCEESVSEICCGLEKEETLSIHSECILSIHGSDAGPGRILTVGFDKAIRIINCSTLETLSGGKLNKRLAHGHRLTLGVLEHAMNEEEYNHSRVLIGSSNGKVFIFSSVSNPPEWLHTVEGESLDPITAMHLAGANLLVAQKYQMTIYRIGRPGQDTPITSIAIYKPELTSGRTIRAIAIAKTAPLLFLGHSGTVTVWDCAETVCVSAFNAHQGPISKLQVLEDGEFENPHHLANKGSRPLNTYEAKGKTIHLMTGGRQGSIKVWKLNHVHQLKLWQPSLAEETSGLSTVSATPEGNQSQELESDQTRLAHQPIPSTQRQGATESPTPSLTYRKTPPAPTRPGAFVLPSLPSNNESKQHFGNSEKNTHNSQNESGMSNGSRLLQNSKKYHSDASDEEMLFPADGFTQVVPHRH